jgi:hypothetical protein
MLLALLDQYTDDVDRAADEIGTFFDHLRQVGIRSLVAERLNDSDYTEDPEHRKGARRPTNGRRE